ncbi:hypothetical protein IWW45_006467 [Coemansia sp. RSA 485]|nr:hypothetical protein IWW45_006467 [Coemansia sp. RSA 485]
MNKKSSEGRPYISSIKRKFANQAVKQSTKSRTWHDGMFLADYAANEEHTVHKQLIVLDLNGTLVHRSAKVDGVRKTKARPGLSAFLSFALKNFAVMVWSSAQPGSIVSMLNSGFGAHAQDLVRVWDRRFCDLDGSYFSKSKSIKDLTRITDGFDLSKSPNCNVYGSYDGYLGVYPPKHGHWKLEDIVLVDDSESKAALQKDNHIFISTFAGQQHDFELDILKSYLQGYLDQKDALPHLLEYVKANPWLEYRRNFLANQDEVSIDFDEAHK